MSEFQDYTSDAAVAADLAQKQSHLQAGRLVSDVALISKDVKIVDLEQYYEGRERVRGTFSTVDKSSFINYVTGNAKPEEVRVFVDQPSMQANAILNFAVEGFVQGHLDHVASLRANKTVVFKVLRDRHMSGRCPQKNFAEFLEDWGHVVKAYDNNYEVIDTAKAINAIRTMRINETAQTDSNVSSNRESRSRMELVEAKSIDGALPAYFLVNDACYRDLPERTLKLRLGISQDDGKPLFKIEIVGLQLLEDELAKDFAALVESGFDDTCEVLIGEFNG